jgi:hypothetical protein
MPWRIFGAGAGALEAHRSVGFAIHGLEVLLLPAAVIAWLPRTDLLLSLLLVVVGTAQITLAEAHRWAGGLHPLGAMLVLAVASVLAKRSPQRRASRQ